MVSEEDRDEDKFIERFIQRDIVARTNATSEQAKELAKDYAAMHRELSEQAGIDSLTRLPNRRRIEEELDTNFHRVKRSKEPYYVAIGDVDNFKGVNDEYGHPAGDAVLSEIGRRIKETKRREDVAGRYGGEEFVFGLNADSLEKAKIAVERIRASIKEKPFEILPPRFALSCDHHHPI